jgi:hypothetical protein
LGVKNVLCKCILKNKQLSYRTELIKKKEGRKEERLFCPSLISVAVSVIIIYHATVIEAVLQQVELVQLLLQLRLGQQVELVQLLHQFRLGQC